MQILSVIILVKGGPLLKNEGIYISLNYVVRITPLPQGFARREQWDNVIWIIFMLNFSYFHLNTKKLCIFPIFEWRNAAFEINLSPIGDWSDFMTTKKQFWSFSCNCLRDNFDKQESLVTLCSSMIPAWNQISSQKIWKYFGPADPMPHRKLITRRHCFPSLWKKVCFRLPSRQRFDAFSTNGNLRKSYHRYVDGEVCCYGLYKASVVIIGIKVFRENTAKMCLGF